MSAPTAIAAMNSSSTSSSASNSATAAAAASCSVSNATECAATPSPSSLDLPSHNSTYKLQEYWNERFTKEAKYEWLSGYASVRDLLRPLLQKESRILHLGCGNSDLGRDLYLDGFTNITNIDFSPACITAQRARNADIIQAHNKSSDSSSSDGLVFLEMDMLDLQFPDASFDIVLDKCTLDALVVNEGDPWNPRAEVREEVDRVLSGISRILKPQTGMYLQLSFGQPIHRLNSYFEKEKYGWMVEVQKWGAKESSVFDYYFYIMRRTTDTAALQQFYEAKRNKQEEEDRRVEELAETMRRAHESDDEHDEERMMTMDL